MKFAKIETFKVGDQVRIKSMARTDAIGFIREIKNDEFAIVRLEAWQADGYHLDVACRLPYELTKVTTSKKGGR